MSAITNTPPSTSSSSPVPSMDSDLLNTTLVSGSRNDTDDERNEGLAVIEVAISGTILFLAVAGNCIVVVSLMVKPGKLSRMHLMMLHLSLADLSVAFFQVLPQMVWDITFRFQGGAFLCGAVKYLQLVTMYASSYVLVSTAVDRYVAICRPFLSHKWTSTHAHLLVLAAWLASLLFSLPQIFIFSLSEVGEGTGVYDCWASFDPPWTLKLYITWNAFSVFFAPSLTLAVLYGHISYAVWKSSKMAEKLTRSYKPVSKGPKEAASPRHHGNGAAGLTPGLTAWHSSTPSSTSDRDTSTTSLHDLDRPDHTLPGPDTRQTYSSAKPWNRGNGSDAASVQISHGDGRPSDAEVTPTLSAASDYAGFSGQRGTGRCPVLSENLSPSTRLLGNKAKSGNTFRKGTSRDLHGNGRSPDVRKTGWTRGNPGRTSSGGFQRSGTSKFLQPSGSSRSTRSTASARDVHGASGTRGTGGVGISRAKMKTIKLTLTVVICYLVCWTPFYVAQLWAAYDENISYENIFFTLVLLLASVNSCTNPWIYMVFSDTICNTIRAIAHPCFRPSAAHNGPPSRRRRGDNLNATYRSSVVSTAAGSSGLRSEHCQFNGVTRI